MDLKLLQTLKHKLVHGESFGDAFEYFLDHFGEKPEFMSHGERIDDPVVVAAIESVTEKLFEGEVRMTPPLLVSIPEHKFIHGSCLINGGLTIVVYYTDLDMGILAIQRPQGTTFARITTYRVDPDKAVGFEPRTSGGLVN